MKTKQQHPLSVAIIISVLLSCMIFFLPLIKTPTTLVTPTSTFTPIVEAPPSHQPIVTPVLTSTPGMNLPFNFPVAIGLFFLGIIVVAFLIIVAQRLLDKNLPIAYNIAFIGFPRSGKTTIITSLFGEIFARKAIYKSIQATLTGKSTIDRVNVDWSLLQRGIALGPTTDQDLFAYRTNITLKGILFSRTYKVEIGDFPGEDSKKFSEDQIAWLQSQPFIKWAVDADALVFVIDMGKYLIPEKRNEYIAVITGAFRVLWQNLIDSVENGAKTVRQRPVVLVFHKMDIFDELSSHNYAEIETTIASLGYSEKIPEVKVLDMIEVEKAKKQLEEDFFELIGFFKSETRNFTVVFSSCFGTVRGNRLGIFDILNAALPRKQ